MQKSSFRSVRERVKIASQDRSRPGKRAAQFHFFQLPIWVLRPSPNHPLHHGRRSAGASGCRRGSCRGPLTESVLKTEPGRGPQATGLAGQVPAVQAHAPRHRDCPRGLEHRFPGPRTRGTTTGHLVIARPAIPEELLVILFWKISRTGTFPLSSTVASSPLGH